MTDTALHVLPSVLAQLPVRHAALWGLIVFRRCFDLVVTGGSRDDRKQIEYCHGVLHALVDPAAPAVVSAESICSGLDRSASYCEAIAGAGGSAGKAGWALYHLFTHLGFLGAGLDGPGFSPNDPLWDGFGRALKLCVTLTADNPSVATQRAVATAKALLELGPAREGNVLGEPIPHGLLERLKDLAEHGCPWPQ